jgi:translocation and assembly module TamA
MVTGQFGLVGFLDAGSVGELEAPDFSNLRLGAGLGLRYATAIGPLRLDVGLPLNREPGDSRFGIYIGLGQAF